MASSAPSSSATSGLVFGGDSYGAIPTPALPPGAYGNTTTAAATAPVNWSLIAIVGAALVALILFKRK